MPASRFHVIVAWLNSVLLTRHLAYGLKLTFWHGAAIFLIIHVGAAIPSAPCNPGTWQFLIVVGLTLFGIDKTRAIRFLSCRVSDPCHPLRAAAPLVFARPGLSLHKIRTEIASLGKAGPTQQSIDQKGL